MTASIILTHPVLLLRALIAGVCFKTVSSNRRNGFVLGPIVYSGSSLDVASVNYFKYLAHFSPLNIRRHF